MPTLQDIETFKQDLNAIGNEEKVLAERGESFEDVAPPEQGLSDDLSALLDNTFEDESEGVEEQEASEAAGAEEEQAAEEPFSFDDLSALGDFEIEEDEPTGYESTDEEFDLEGIFDEPDSEEEASSVEDGGDSGLSEAEYAGLAGFGEEEPDEELADFDIEEAEEPPEEAEEPPEEAEEPPEEAEEPPEEAEEPPEEAEFDFDLPSELEFEAVDEVPEVTEEDDFSVPEEFSFADIDEDDVAVDEELADVDEELADVDEDDYDIPEEFSFDDEEIGGFVEDDADVDEDDADVDEDDVDVDEDDVDVDEDDVEDDAPASAVEEADEFQMPETPAGVVEEEEAGDETAAVPDIDELGEEDFDLDDFSLGDIGEEFGVSEEEEEIPTEEELNPALAVSEDLPGSDDAFRLRDGEYASLQETLHFLPRNLRIVVEELIGEEQLSGDPLRSLVDALVRGKSPREIAALTSRITGKRIVIPRQYEKRTGLEFEEERGSFAYAFRNNILPILRVIGISAVLLSVVVFLGYRFVYRPVYAELLYRRGYTELRDGSYVPANEYFDRALDQWVRKPWFYRFADRFLEHNRDDLAAEKYEQLLRYYPTDKRGLLDYAELETYHRARYEHAEELLDRILDRELYHYQALLAMGDNYMEWAREDPSRYEDARFAYASLLERYGSRDEVMFRMLRYFIRTNNQTEVLRLRDHFQALSRIAVEPRVYAELGGYLITIGRLDGVKDVLFRAMGVDAALPEVHYNLARYFRRIGDHGEEDKALANALALLRAGGAPTADHERMLVDTLKRQGESRFRSERYLEAEQRFLEAMNAYEDARNRGRLRPEPMFGEIYAGLGDIYYYVGGDYDTARLNYLEAEANGYTSPSLHYKIGNIAYRRAGYDTALLRFYNAAGDYSSNPNLMYATANTLYQRRNYAAAQGYYLHVLDMLEAGRRNIANIMPDERADHRALLENLQKTYNNLGVSLYRLSEATGDPAKVSQALVNLTRSSEYFDALTRDSSTLVRTESKNLAYINTRAILYPEAGFDLEIHNTLPRDFRDLEF